jgi:hypothetical protein
MNRPSLTWLALVIYTVCIFASVMDSDCCALEDHRPDGHHARHLNPGNGLHALKHVFEDHHDHGDHVCIRMPLCCCLGNELLDSGIGPHALTRPERGTIRPADYSSHSIEPLESQPSFQYSGSVLDGGSSTPQSPLQSLRSVRLLI